MKLRWLVALAVGFALIWASAVLAGPSTPVGGDPDIWDRAKPPVRSAPRPVSISPGTAVDIDMVVFKASVRQQGALEKVEVDNSRLRGLYRPVFGTR
jgi:phosphate-selective porin